MMFAHSIYSFFTLTQITDAPPVVDEDPLNLDPDYDPNEASDETSHCRTCPTLGRPIWSIRRSLGGPNDLLLTKNTLKNRTSRNLGRPNI